LLASSIRTLQGLYRFQLVPLSIYTPEYMKALTRIFLLAILCLLTIDASAQSGYFSKFWNFNSIDEVPTKYEVYTKITSNTPDVAAKGQPILLDGDPTIEEVHEFLFKYAEDGYGQFFRTEKSKDKIIFMLDYGYNYDDDQRIFFDSIVASTGDIGNETNRQNLPRNEIVRDCNIVKQNCYVFQRYYYDFDRSELYMNPENAYAKLLIYRYYKYNKVVKTLILPIVIEGTTEIDIGDHDGPIELISILRTPPGDKSSVKLINTNETTRQIRMSFSKTNSETQTESAKISVGFEKGPVSAETEVEATSSQTFEETVGKENTYSAKFSSTTEFENKYRSDKFVVAKYEYNYKVEYTVSTSNFNAVLLKVNASQRMLMIPLNKKELLLGSFTEEFLLSKHIPRLLLSNDSAEAKYYQDIIALNYRIKAEPGEGNGTEITGAIKQKFSSTLSKEETITQEISLKTDRSIKITDKGGIEVGSVKVGGEISAEHKWSVSTTTSSENTSGVEESKQIEYEHDDEQLNAGDEFKIYVKVDGTFGTPVFVLDEDPDVSKTSSPYEGGFQRDHPKITVLDPITFEQVKSAKFSDLEEGQEVRRTARSWRHRSHTRG
jgi:hypothetical protein